MDSFDTVYILPVVFEVEMILEYKAPHQNNKNGTMLSANLGIVG
jgi:hypothetical protein